MPRANQVFDRYRSFDPEMLKGDRAVQNTHEQMVPFLVSMWMYALVVSPDAAAGLGGVYVVLRSLYPLLLGPRVELLQSRRVAFVTFPCLRDHRLDARQRCCEGVDRLKLITRLHGYTRVAIQPRMSAAWKH